MEQATSDAREQRRRRMELALRKSEERFRSVVEAAPSAMVMVGSDGRIEMVNAQAEQLFGYARHDLLGRPVELLVPERFRGEHPGHRGAFLSDPRSRPMGAGRDLFALRSDGTEVPVEIGLNPIETEDGIMVLSAIVDISDRKQKEARIQEALKEKDLLLAEVHHRVKNNLQVVHSLLNLQAYQIADPVARDLLRECQNRVQSMALIHQTLYQSKDFAEVDFRLFLDALIPTLLATYGIDSSRVSLEISATDVHLPINIAVPCGLVVNELISNALKHAFPNGRAGSVSVEIAPCETDSICLAVSDSGIGLAPESTPEEGNSLGLQLVVLLCEQLRGKLEISRADPTRFAVTFPVGG